VIPVPPPYVEEALAATPAGAVLAFDPSPQAASVRAAFNHATAAPATAASAVPVPPQAAVHTTNRASRKAPSQLVTLTAAAEALDVRTLRALLDLFAHHDLLYEVAIQLLQYASV
jgi:hypothetical protein